jgi:3-dehydroquinate dehydratase-1
MICVSIGNINFEKALEICHREELVEIRADLLNFEDNQYLELFNAGARIIFTCRRADYTLDKRIKLYSQAIESPVDLIDLDIYEDEDLISKLKPQIEDRKSRLILSYHNFEETPDTQSLKSIVMEMYSFGADIAKIACLVSKDEDLVNLLSLYRKKGNKLVIGMGEKGLITRVAAVFMGAEFTFAFPDDGSMTAPGQLTKKDLEDIFEIMRP